MKRKIVFYTSAIALCAAFSLLANKINATPSARELGGNVAPDCPVSSSSCKAPDGLYFGYSNEGSSGTIQELLF